MWKQNPKANTALQKVAFGQDRAAVSSPNLVQRICSVPIFGVKFCPRYTVRYSWTGSGLTSILAWERQGTNGLSNVTAKESISV